MIALLLAAQIAVTNVDVLTMEDGAAYRRAQTVVMDKGLIVSVGPAMTTAVPAGARRIDGTGMVLLPGLADMHVHLEAAPATWLGAFLRSGITSVLNLRGDSSHVALRERVKHGDVIGPTIYTSGPYTNRPNVETEADAIRAAREQQAAGYDVIKIHGPIGSLAYRALLDSARISVVGHAPRNLDFDSVIRMKQAMIAHAEELIYTKFNTLDTTTFGDLPARMAAAGIWLIPTLSTFHGITAQWGRPAAVDSALSGATPEMLNAGLREYWLKQNPYTARSLADAPRQIAAYRFQLVLVRRLFDAGVRMMTGTDTPLPVMFPGSSLHLEVAELIGAGIPVYDVLLMATRNAGDFVRERIDGTVRAGRISSGYRADIIMVRGNPLTDPTVLQHPDVVIAAGRVVVER